MILNEFDQIVKEYFDLSDRATRQYIISLDESGEDQLLAALSARLYDNIVAKVDNIDFGTKGGNDTNGRLELPSTSEVIKGKTKCSE